MITITEQPNTNRFKVKDGYKNYGLFNSVGDAEDYLIKRGLMDKPEPEPAPKPKRKRKTKAQKEAEANEANEANKED